jgi:hypothetical protein
MVLKTETYKTEDGTEVIIKELSFAARVRLEAIAGSKGRIDTEDLYKECITPWEAMENIGREESEKILDIYAKLNPGKKDSPSET